MAIFDIRDHGAAGDGRMNNAPALQHAIDSCHEAGGGTVLVPAGGVFRSGTIELRSNVELHVERGAVLSASPDLPAYTAGYRVSAISNGFFDPHRPTLADGWRTGNDIECYSCEKNGSSFPLTDWRNVAARFDAVASWQPFGGQSGWNDEDSVEIGNGPRDGLTVPQRQTVLSLWSLAGAPLILGTDLTQLTSVDKAMLENRAVIAIDQDGIAATRLIDHGSEQVFAKHQPDGTWYVGIFNTDTSTRQTFHVRLAQLGLRHAIRAVDVWTGRPIELAGGSYSVTIAPGGASLISVLG